LANQVLAQAWAEFLVAQYGTVPEDRRLAAVMFTDIVGYSSLTQKDERLAVELLEKHRRIIRPIAARHVIYSLLKKDWRVSSISLGSLVVQD
jgi:class 3 adenylate cyclase